MKTIVLICCLLLLLISANLSYAQVSILNTENLEGHFPEKFEGMERGSLTRRKTESGHKIISTGYLIVTPENQITSTVIVSPAIGSVNAGLVSLEARLKLSLIHI